MQEDGGLVVLWGLKGQVLAQLHRHSMLSLRLLNKVDLIVP